MPVAVKTAHAVSHQSFRVVGERHDTLRCCPGARAARARVRAWHRAEDAVRLPACEVQLLAALCAAN